MPVATDDFQVLDALMNISNKLDIMIAVLGMFLAFMVVYVVILGWKR